MVAVNAMAASRPNAATPRANRMARRRRSRSSCTSSINSSKRFSPMINNRRAKRFNVSTSRPTLLADDSMTGSVAVAAAAARGQIADERPHTEGDADGLIGMLVHGLVRSFCAFDRFVADAAIHFLPAVRSEERRVG